MKSVCTFLLLILWLCPTVAFQNQDVLLAKVDDLEIRSGELKYAYQKNRDSSEPLDYDSLKQYLEQYINFKLKVLEARALGYDTLTALNEELQGYISQIRKPYLSNDRAAQKLVREIYNRMHIEVDASHILINVKTNASPQDTLNAYRLIDSLRSVAKSQNQFENLAKQFSQDGSANLGGKLGWFTALDMVSPFEDAAYKTASGEVSEIVRTRFGYHILYINRKRTSRGKLKTSHIFFNTQQRSPDQIETLANSVYDSLMLGADWNAMARKYSDDARTKMKGGQLPLARIKQLPDDFLDIAYSLEKLGDISPPSRTQFGWHIVRLDETEPIPSFDALEKDITESLKRSGRNSLTNDQLIKKLKLEDNYRQNEPIYQKVIDALLGLKTDSLQALEMKTLFSLEGKDIKVEEFLKFLPSQNIALGREVLTSLYAEFEKAAIIAYEDSLAPIKYPDYAYLLKEYEEGLLLFEVMQKEVWNRGLEDSIGAEAYYLKNIDDYYAEKRFKTMSFSPSGSKSLEKLKSNASPTVPLDSLIDKLLTNEERSLLKIVKRTIKASEIPSFETTGLKSGSWIENQEAGELYFIDKVIPAGPYEYEEIRGLVISDYQDYLDREWIKKLRKKRNIKVYNKALKTISKN